MSNIDYSCNECRAEGVKLWRESHNYSGPLVLLCVACCCARNEVDPSTVDGDGVREREPGRSTDQIGWWVPAIPDWDGEGMWGYTSTPNEDYERWRVLPTRVMPCPGCGASLVDATGDFQCHSCKRLWPRDFDFASLSPESGESDPQ